MLSSDDVAAWTRALEPSPTPDAWPSDCVAPLRFAEAGITVERGALEEAVAAVSGRGASARANDAPATIDLDAFLELMAAHETDQRKRKALRARGADGVPREEEPRQSRAKRERGREPVRTFFSASFSLLTLKKVCVM